MIEQALVSLLSSNDFIIYAAPLPQSVPLPALTYQSIDEIPDYHLTGEKPYRVPNFQVSAWAGSKAHLVNLKENLRGLISGWSGTIAGLSIHSILIKRIVDMPEIEVKKYRAVFDLEISYEEA